MDVPIEFKLVPETLNEEINMKQMTLDQLKNHEEFLREQFLGIQDPTDSNIPYRFLDDEEKQQRTSALESIDKVKYQVRLCRALQMIHTEGQQIREVFSDEETLEVFILTEKDNLFYITDVGVNEKLDYLYPEKISRMDIANYREFLLETCKVYKEVSMAQDILVYNPEKELYRIDSVYYYTVQATKEAFKIAGLKTCIYSMERESKMIYQRGYKWSEEL